MTIQRTIKLYKGNEFFPQGFPIYVNRFTESFDLFEHSHDFLEISYVGEGSGTQHIGDATLPVSQGDIFLIPVGVSHVYRPSSTSRNNPLVVYNCVVSIEAIDQWLHNIPTGEGIQMYLKDKMWKRYQDKNTEYYRIFQKLHAEYTFNRLGRETALYLTVMELLLYLYRDEIESKPAASLYPVTKSMDSILQFLNDNLNMPITQSQMAMRLRIGERQFHRLFTKQIGSSLKDYLQTLRINEACRLLRVTDRKINDIASAVGYQDMPFFNQLFKRKTGISPRNYRLRIH